MMEVTSL